MVRDEKKQLIETIAKKIVAMDESDRAFFMGYMTGKEEERMKWQKKATA